MLSIKDEISGITKYEQEIAGAGKKDIKKLFCAKSYISKNNLILFYISNRFFLNNIKLGEIDVCFQL